jgi:hypothetical protein
MTIEVAVIDRLLSLPPVAALVGTRIYALILPQNPTLPAIRVERISQVEPMHLRGPINLFSARVQVDSVAISKAAADSVDAAVQGDGLGDIASGLKGFRGEVGSPGFLIRAVRVADVRESYGEIPERREFRISRDFFIDFVGTS